MKVWKEPKLTEIVVSMEVTAYFSAELPDDVPGEETQPRTARAPRQHSHAGPKR